MKALRAIDDRNSPPASPCLPKYPPSKVASTTAGGLQRPRPQSVSMIPHPANQLIQYHGSTANQAVSDTPFKPLTADILVLHLVPHLDFETRIQLSTVSKCFRHFFLPFCFTNLRLPVESRIRKVPFSKIPLPDIAFTSLSMITAYRPSPNNFLTSKFVLNGIRMLTLNLKEGSHRELVYSAFSLLGDDSKLESLRFSLPLDAVGQGPEFPSWKLAQSPAQRVFARLKHLEVTRQDVAEVMDWANLAIPQLEHLEVSAIPSKLEDEIVAGHTGGNIQQVSMTAIPRGARLVTNLFLDPTVLPRLRKVLLRTSNGCMATIPAGLRVGSLYSAEGNLRWKVVVRSSDPTLQQHGALNSVGITPSELSSYLQPTSPSLVQMVKINPCEPLCYTVLLADCLPCFARLGYILARSEKIYGKKIWKMAEHITLHESARLRNPDDHIDDPDDPFAASNLLARRCHNLYVDFNAAAVRSLDMMGTMPPFMEFCLTAPLESLRSLEFTSFWNMTSYILLSPPILDLTTMRLLVDAFSTRSFLTNLSFDYKLLIQGTDDWGLRCGHFAYHLRFLHHAPRFPGAGDGLFTPLRHLTKVIVKNWHTCPGCFNSAQTIIIFAKELLGPSPAARALPPVTLLMQNARWVIIGNIQEYSWNPAVFGPLDGTVWGLGLLGSGPERYVRVEIPDSGPEESSSSRQ